MTAKNQMTVLVVDDDPILVEVLAHDVRRMGFHCLIASKSSQVLTELQRTPVHVLLTDIRMPITDGLTLVQDLRKEGFSMPVVFLTGFPDKANLLQALRLKAVDFLEKPYDRDALRDALTSAAEVGQSASQFQATMKRLIEEGNLKVEVASEIQAKHEALLFSLMCRPSHRPNAKKAG